VAGSCEHGNEISGSIKCCVIVESLKDWRLQEGFASMELIRGRR
jgi:hypothetical protein